VASEAKKSEYRTRRCRIIMMLAQALVGEIVGDRNRCKACGDMM